MVIFSWIMLLWISCISALIVSHWVTAGSLPHVVVFQAAISMVFAVETTLVMRTISRLRTVIKGVASLRPPIAERAYLVALLGLVGWSIGLGSCAEAFDIARWADAGGGPTIFGAIQDFVMAWILMGVPVLALTAVLRRSLRGNPRVSPGSVRKAVKPSWKTAASVAMWIWQHGVILASLDRVDLSLWVATSGACLAGLPLLVRASIDRDLLAGSHVSGNSVATLLATWGLACAVMTGFVTKAAGLG
jgi:hypothetical protein